MNGFLDVVSALAKLLFAGAGGIGIYRLAQVGYVQALDMKGRCAVMAAGTVLATLAAEAIRLLNGAGQFAFVLLVGLAWIIAFPWLVGRVHE